MIPNYNLLDQSSSSGIINNNEVSGNQYTQNARQESEEINGSSESSENSDSNNNINKQRFEISTSIIVLTMCLITFIVGFIFCYVPENHNENIPVNYNCTINNILSRKYEKIDHNISGQFNRTNIFSNQSANGTMTDIGLINVNIGDEINTTCVENYEKTEFKSIYIVDGLIFVILCLSCCFMNLERNITKKMTKKIFRYVACIFIFFCDLYFIGRYFEHNGLIDLFNFVLTFILIMSFIAIGRSKYSDESTLGGLYYMPMHITLLLWFSHFNPKYCANGKCDAVLAIVDTFIVMIGYFHVSHDAHIIYQIDSRPRKLRYDYNRYMNAAIDLFQSILLVVPNTRIVFLIAKIFCKSNSYLIQTDQNRTNHVDPSSAENNV